MAIIGKLLAGRRAGETGLAWNRPGLANGTEFSLTSPDFEHDAHLDIAHASKRVGGRDHSPALSWSGAPEGTAQYLLVVEDVDVPMPKPVLHCAALLDGSLNQLPANALQAGTSEPGVRILRSMLGRGYMGPAPIRGHGPHRYVFQLFALAEPLDTLAGKAVDQARPKLVLEAARATARARIDGLYERP
ncbi:MAG: YbhB/YbcL family Raf kinase inhibitor-like protein [Nocardia sp.]|nr:YbhB/YbcL family Raf kinase inhibitor-like protein [Nocardia sp.]